MSIFTRPQTRRPLAALLLVLFAGFQFGWQFAHPVADPSSAGLEKSHSARYPCEDSPCACRSAEACWRSCCCHTDREKVAWAERNGVELPEFVRRAAAREEAAASCCQVKAGRDADVASCAASLDDVHPNTEDAQPETATAPRTKHVLGWAALECRGLALDVLSGGILLIPPPQPPRADRERPIGRVCLLSPLAVSVALAPPVPPPRV